MTTTIHVVLKFSGQLLVDLPGNRKIISDWAAFIEERVNAGKDEVFHLVAGGGRKVDNLRDAYEKLPCTIQETWEGVTHAPYPGKHLAAHLLAIKFMDENGLALERFVARGRNRSETPGRPARPSGEPNPRVPRFWPLPSYLDGLPPSWSVTSDSIAYAYAMSGFPRNPADSVLVVLLKNVDGVLAVNGKISRRTGEIGNELIKRLDLNGARMLPSLPVDDYILDLVEKHGVPFHVMNFRFPSRLEKLLDGDHKNFQGTTISPR